MAAIQQVVMVSFSWTLGCQICRLSESAARQMGGLKAKMNMWSGGL